ncbi:hypothetical protein JX265_003891 [Neoarthrinium moseri]|uniref:Uncharacterized protein n=1 Tax=Neoarthrinium moseri TaxID=1658444 RepID=A0A9Q0ANX3_9PEZI|nr:hypothetical protein JX265_003891 [Neoarthrinium moseri]
MVPPTNFRTYEAQARLLAAVVASTGCRLDFKAIADHIGSQATPSSVDHRLRPIKQLAKLQAQWLKGGKDPSDLPTDAKEIQKLFGESTPGSLDFHFREVKATGKAQQEAVKKGLDPSKVTIGTAHRYDREAKAQKRRGSAPTTPAARRIKDVGSAKRAPATTGGRASKKARLVELDDDDEDSPDVDYDHMDVTTPSARPKPRETPNAAYQVNNSASNSEDDAPASPSRARGRHYTPQSFTHGGHTNDYSVTDAPDPATFGMGADGMGAYSTNTSFSNSAKAAPAARPASNMNPNTAAADHDDDDDDLMEINASQFSASSSMRVNPAQPRSVAIKKDPFESTSTEGYFDLTYQNENADLSEGEV